MSTAGNQQQQGRQRGNDQGSRDTSGDLVVFSKAIEGARTRFLEVSGGDLGPFIRENEFAMMRLRQNTFTWDIARKNPNSLRDALIQAAVTGLSLNPVAGHAYLVPRDGMICFDPSYRGLRDTAVADGIVRWVRADVVFAADLFSFEELGNGDRIVNHQFDAFSTDRGAIVGGYCAWEDSEGHRDFITETLDELHSSHRSRSVAWTKSSGGIWKTDLLQAIRKSLIKRAHTSWPRKPGTTGRFDAALAASIAADDSLDVTAEKASAEVVRALIERVGPQASNWAGFYGVTSLEDLTAEQASNMQRHLDLRAEKRAREEAKQQPAAVATGAASAPAAASGSAPAATSGPSTDSVDVDVDALWREIDDGLGLLADGDLGRADAIASEIRTELGLPAGDLVEADVKRLRDAVVARA